MSKRGQFATVLLFPRASFWTGVARLFDFGNNLASSRSILSSEKIDALSLAADWRALGFDMRQAIRKFEDEAHLR